MSTDSLEVSPGRYNLTIQSMIEFRSKTIQFNFRFKRKLSGFNSIKYSIQNYSWPIQFNKIVNSSLEFQEVLHEKQVPISWSLILVTMIQPFILKAFILGPIWSMFHEKKTSTFWVPISWSLILVTIQSFILKVFISGLGLHLVHVSWKTGYLLGPYF